MLHQCGHQCSAYPCSCGFVYGGCGGGGASFSFLFPIAGKHSVDEDFDVTHSTSSSPSLVDCTLSLGTPSTRQTESKPTATFNQIQRTSCMSSFRWDIISQSKKNSPMGSTASSGGDANGSSLGGDPLLLARRCANCDTTSTPLWRNGPRGPKSLCNACGIRYKKEERRAAASSSVPPSSSPSVTAAAGDQGIGYGYHRQQQSPWSCYASSTMKSSSSIAMYDEMADHGEAPYLSWQFNVAPSPQFPVRDRPSLFQYN
ncbi:GATA zinc finger domain containing protein [Musa troglodytarum]|uniref:GATA zinc finger domain containing protein n=1 Tax=Musa troglodytarum TaxID=320322 RepID=A0A9E7GPC3_9LILI|nr:GATA zinc finger domain containing protein [Musa troglodytarum]